MNTTKIEKSLIVIALAIYALGAMWTIGLFDVRSNVPVHAESLVTSYNWTEYREMAHTSKALVTIKVSVTSPNNAHNPRYNACRTYLFGGYDANDGINCGEGRVQRPERDSDDTAYIVLDDTESPVIDNPVKDTFTPPQDDKAKKDNCGNPGNYKNVGKAGEKDDKGMDESPPNGQHGNSDNPDKGNKNH